MLDAGTAVVTRTLTFTVEPGVVHITSPTDGSSGYVGPVVVAGTASSPVSIVNVQVDGDAGGWQTAFDDTGAWSVDVGTLPAGTHTICATVLDRNYTEDAEDCVTYTVTIDPALLTIATPEQGATTGPAVTVTGECADGTTVLVSLDDTAGTSQPCIGGYYTQELPSPLASGTHAVRVSMLFGDQEVTSLERAFTVDATAPATPTITSPATKKTITSPTLPLVGTAEPGSTVYVRAPGTVDRETVTAIDGTWRITLDAAFFDEAGVVSGRRAQLDVVVSAGDAYGNVSAPRTYAYTVQLR